MGVFLCGFQFGLLSSARVVKMIPLSVRNFCCFFLTSISKLIEGSLDIKSVFFSKIVGLIL